LAGGHRLGGEEAVHAAARQPQKGRKAAAQMNGADQAVERSCGPLGPQRQQ
jgi:hypothetical protein